MSKRTICKRCGKESSLLSARGRCPECGAKAQLDNIQGIKSKKGVCYEKWVSRYRKGMKAYAQRLQEEEE
ncbi:MAG: hypothetical protein DDT19_01720 [Syntrophomonadaceae bacterium]|nr:hypothetical protein [Bacillota bacterium]